jgi:hypothetical protein
VFFRPRRQQLNRFQFLVRLPESRNALLAPGVLHVICEAVDVGVPQFFCQAPDRKNIQGRCGFLRGIAAKQLTGMS